MLDTLIRCGALLGERIDCYFVLSKSGFTDVCRERAANPPNIELVSLGEVF